MVPRKKRVLILLLIRFPLLREDRKAFLKAQSEARVEAKKRRASARDDKQPKAKPSFEEVKLTNELAGHRAKMEECEKALRALRLKALEDRETQLHVKPVAVSPRNEPALK